MLASRLGKRHANRQGGSNSEFNLAPWLNRLFERIMNFERYLIGKGLRFRLGGSQLLIATKER